MKKLLLLLPALLYITMAYGQNTFRAIIRDDKTKQPLIGASAYIAALKLGTTTDTTGHLTLSVPNGNFEIVFSYIGYSKTDKGITFPMKNPDSVTEIYLEPQGGELAEVTIQTTRTNQNLSDIATRIEALPAEELDEKGTMRPGDIKMLLQESTGIAVQATSAVSGSANVRIQGLDSRYTQLLKDGMPMYQGFSGGLSLLQISPLDLKQVEYIKGSASTLYGGGAIAGLVNLISKTPVAKPELTFLLNGTSANGADASVFYSQKWKHTGVTVFGSYNYNGAYDPSATGFTAIPQTNRFTVNPKLFLYLDDNNKGWIGFNTTYENRFGGDVQLINGNADNTHQYFERNESYRSSTQLSFTHTIDAAASINLKNTIGYFDRRLAEPGSVFKGTQWSSFSEVNYVRNGKKANWVTGVNLLTDIFSAQAPLNNLNYNLTTLGVFGQNNFKANNVFSLESGLRVDYNSPAEGKGIFVLPRVNALFKINEHFTSRIGGGLGYKMPALFNDVSEADGYQHIQPISFTQTKAEQSYGANADVTYRGPLGDCYLTFNQLFFYTYVDHPILLVNNTFINAPGNIYTRGGETNIKLTADGLGIYLGYTYTDTKLHYNGITSTQPLTPENRVSFDLTYEVEGSFRAGAEAFYTGQQLLNDGTIGKDYLTFGLLIQKMWKHLDIYVNCENLTDRRQTRWDNIYTGSITRPVFRDIYAPLDGVVVNAGIRIKVL
ncbi:TonB-dependent receptor [Mucilaginibacter sp. HMF5004]|uniref:TonB-dependent receptor n=1 Tax=Mucilaginibacter rivuli TaxID=2857527 RepID=UPI001C5EFC2C|nr:TonB-dependent receptor [Mucilaginibacter rivuli]MBW4889710.1 TonB-dependent receptor [Mucilaginibacter rivuli]